MCVPVGFYDVMLRHGMSCVFKSVSLRAPRSLCRLEAQMCPVLVTSTLCHVPVAVHMSHGEHGCSS